MQSLAHLVANGTTNGSVTKTAPNGIPENHKRPVSQDGQPSRPPSMEHVVMYFGRHHQGNGVEMSKFEAYSLTISELFDHPPPG